MQPKENEALPEKHKKRRLKTPSQVEALEKLYNEHKYPSEMMKAQLANEIGLSEKQVSGWFCHRRLKDKNMLLDEAFANGRQDVSSGIIQDRGSVLKQDSCGSTKQGEYIHFDPREAESQRSYGHDYPAVDLTYGNRGKYMQLRYHSAMDKTSSGSSSASQGRLFTQHQDSYDMEPLGYSSRSSNYIMMNATGGNKREYMAPSRYYCSQNDIENAAIANVKSQLGRHYQEDGPPLGVDFQSLPPGAFDSPIRDSTNEPYYVADPLSFTVHRDLKEPSLDVGHARYNCNIGTQGSYPAGAHLRRTICESDLRNEHGSYQSMRKSSFAKYSSHHSGRNLSMGNTDEDSAGETSKFKNTMNYGVKCKRETEGIGSDSIALNPLRPRGIETHELSYPKLENRDDSGSLVLRREEYLEGRPSDLIVTRNEFLNKEKREYCRRIAKEEKLYRGKRSTEYVDPNGEKTRQKDELKGKKKRQVNELLAQEYVVKAPASLGLLPRENHMKGYAGDMPTSFSEDETVATSSSMD